MELCEEEVATTYIIQQLQEQIKIYSRQKRQQQKFITQLQLK